jgi:23S rRNA (uridine2552-2'-O)-methyltransferase
MKRSKSSQDWLRRHVDDFYVKEARKAGYRSRAVFKLLELQEKDRLLRSGMVVVDLGAAPGSWSQVAAPIVGGTGAVIAMDILEIEPLAGVTFIQGDFAEQAVYAHLLAMLSGREVDLVMSDLAPNISGVRTVDQPRAMYLAELAVDFSQEVLKPGGSFVTKVFQGEGFDPYLKVLRGVFSKVVVRKPKASRPKSREVYMLGRGFVGRM